MLFSWGNYPLAVLENKIWWWGGVYWEEFFQAVEWANFWLVSPARKTLWLSSWIFFHLQITGIILILLILAAVSLWTADDWIQCWHKWFYCCLLGKYGMLSFLNSVTPTKFATFLLHWIVSSRSWFKQFTKKFFNFFRVWSIDILKNC